LMVSALCEKAKMEFHSLANSIGASVEYIAYDAVKLRYGDYIVYVSCPSAFEYIEVRVEEYKYGYGYYVVFSANISDEAQLAAASKTVYDILRFTSIVGRLRELARVRGGARAEQ